MKDAKIARVTSFSYTAECSQQHPKKNQKKTNKKTNKKNNKKTKKKNQKKIKKKKNKKKVHFEEPCKVVSNFREKRRGYCTSSRTFSTEGAAKGIRFAQLDSTVCKPQTPKIRKLLVREGVISQHKTQMIWCEEYL